MGPRARWFDFACAAKTPDAARGITAGPEVLWEDGVRREYRVQALCGITLRGEDWASVVAITAG